MKEPGIFWDKSAEEMARFLDSSKDGLSSDEALLRLEKLSRRGGRFVLPPTLRLLFSQFNNFIVLILLFSAILSISLGDLTNGLILLSILLLTGLLGFWQERGAELAVKKLAAMVHVTSKVLRDGKPLEIPAGQVVPGDVVLLAAGDMIPGDALVLRAKDFFVDESALTGETFAAEKRPGVVAAGAPPADRTNALFFGTHSVSGVGSALVLAVGSDTAFEEIKNHLGAGVRVTDFQHGIQKFSAFLAKVTFSLVLTIFFVNMLLARPVLDSFMFSLALAVGLTPQLLPAIISVNLAGGAARMAEKKVIVQRLASIENFGGMDILCSDKTGTLTTGRIKLTQALDASGAPGGVLDYAHVNSAFQTGFVNQLDVAVNLAAAEAGSSLDGWERVDEVPYDFIRKRLSILAKTPQGRQLCISKGAYRKILEICTAVELGGRAEALGLELREELERRFEQFSAQGSRVIALAVKELKETKVLTRGDESGMTFVGLLVFEDPIKEDARQVIGGLSKIGVALKIITGDSAGVARAIALQAGFENPRVVTGGELREKSGASLAALAERADVFAEVEPNQKESIVLAYRKRGHTVGYLGDGINDIPALSAADIGISVDGAVDAARQAADMILLERDLSVLLDGVYAGRRTFANTMKYILMATSANFGNMFSMACAALVMPFLPLLPKQILLTNLLTDLPEMAMSSDNVDGESLQSPQKWNIGFIRAFMVRFGLLSSCFDLLTFYVLLRVMGGDISLVRTGWFVESVVSAVLAVLMVRTRKPFFRSRPHPALVGACLLSMISAVLLTYSALGRELFSFVSLPPLFLLAVAGIALAYALSVELLKYYHYPKNNGGLRRGHARPRRRLLNDDR